MVSARRPRLLGSLIRGNVSRRDQLSNPGVGRSAKLMVQDQHEREGRSDYGKIKCQPSISMPVRIVPGRAVRARRSPRDSSPECTDRSREAATRIGSTDGRRDPPPSVAAESGRMAGNLRHACSAQSAADVVGTAPQQIRVRGRILAAFGRIVARWSRRARRFGRRRISGNVVGRGRVAWFHCIDPELELSETSRRGRSRVGGIRS